MVSGSGTLLDAMVASGLEVAAVLVDRRCAAEQVAQRHGLSLQVIERTDFSDDFDREGYTCKVVSAWNDADIDLVAMAGWGTILTQTAFDARPGNIINTHPALLPSREFKFIIKSINPNKNNIVESVDISAIPCVIG